MSPVVPAPSESGMGTPSPARKIRPNCHPPSTFSPAPPSDFMVGTFQRPLITRLRLTSKSESPLSRLRSYQGVLTGSSEKVSPAVLPEESSTDLLQVKAPCNWKPRLILLSTFTCMPLYQERLWYMVLNMLAALGFSR